VANVNQERDRYANYLRQLNTSEFLPNESLFQARLDAQLAEIRGQLPLSMEAFSAEASRRGVFLSGENLRALYRDVMTPITQQSTTLAATSALEYAKLRSGVGLHVEGMRTQGFGNLMNVDIALEQIKAQRDAQKKGLLGQAFGAVGSVAGAVASPWAAAAFGGKKIIEETTEVT
jgi:hypothetical protein